MNYIYKLNTIKRGYMQNLLLYIKNNLTPTLAQILLQALKNSNNEKFFTFVHDI